MSKKLVLNNDELAEDFLLDACVIGVQCSMAAHVFLWHINKMFLLDLRYQQENEIKLKKKNKSFSFPIYCCNEFSAQMEHTVYVNRHDGEYLLPELKHFDFLWMIKAAQQNQNLIEIIKDNLRQMEEVQMVAELLANKIKNKQNLVF